MKILKYIHGYFWTVELVYEESPQYDFIQGAYLKIHGKNLSINEKTDIFRHFFFYSFISFKYPYPPLSLPSSPSLTQFPSAKFCHEP